MSSMHREPRLLPPAGKTGGARKTADGREYRQVTNFDPDIVSRRESKPARKTAGVPNFGPKLVMHREPKPDYKSRNAALALSRKRAKAAKKAVGGSEANLAERQAKASVARSSMRKRTPTPTPAPMRKRKVINETAKPHRLVGLPLTKTPAYKRKNAALALSRKGAPARRNAALALKRKGAPARRNAALALSRKRAKANKRRKV